ncbi:MAG: fused MFS/spermidine synthase [Nitrososphaera sp.]
MSSSPSLPNSNSSPGTGGRDDRGDYKVSRRLASWILAGLVFVSGFVAMALEFAASRLLTPIFGSSISTWGVLIGIILASLTAGYHIGGRLADSKERPATIQKLCSVMFSSGLYILFIPLVVWPAIQESLTSSPSISMLVASTLLLIALPTVLMGIVSPYAIKLAATTLSTLGKKAGNLYSIATAGSIAGTFVTVFALIPSLEITAITFALGLALIIPAAAFLRRLPKFLAGSLVVLVFVASIAPIDAGRNFLASLADFDSSLNVASLLGTTIHREETPYSHLQVVDSATFSASGAANSHSQSKTRSLFLNGDLHSQMYIDYPNDLALLYTQFFPLGLVFNPDAKSILFVGGGGFSGPKYFLDAYPSIERVDVVEIDPVVVDVAKQYFGVDDSNPKLNIYNDDGRRFLLADDGGVDREYDIIVLDAYSKNYVPFHLMTEEYFQLLNDHLTEDGVIVSNHIGPIGQGITSADWGYAAYEKSKLWRAEYKTMAEVFPSMYVFPTRLNADGSMQNIMLVASKDGTTYDGNSIREKQEMMVAGSNSIYNEDSQGTTNFLQAIDYAIYLYNSTNIRTDDVPIFTDEYAPAEAFLSPLTNAQFDVTDEGELEETATKNTDANIDSEGQAGAIPIATLVIAAIWVFHARRIWKKS